jgi:Nucleotide-diphospho-sugar transferase
MKLKSLILHVILLLNTAAALCQEKIKLYAIYTPSHEILKDSYFLPSIQDDFELIIENVEQTCESAKFMSTGWTKTTMKKVDLIIRAIQENWDSLFIFSDVDIQFFAPVKDIILSLMKDNDIIIQKNCPDGVVCSGFFVCRGNEKTLQLWKDVKKVMKKSSQSDQISLNQCIKRNSKKNPYNITWDYLPDIFFGAGTLTGYSGYSWYPGRKLPIPHDIVMHHANWTKGVPNKIAQLDYVKKHVEQLKTTNRWHSPLAD